MEIYQFKESQAFLLHKISENKEIQGYQGKIAKAATCHSSHISQVMRGRSHFTPDQGARIAAFWKLKVEESEYWLSLIQYERASSDELKKILDSRIVNLRKNYDDLSKRTPAEAINEKNQGIYYKSWINQAVFTLLMVPEFQDINSLSQRLNIDVEQLNDVIDDLVSIGLVSRGENGFEILNDAIHLPKSSPYIWNYHNQWRQFVMMKSQINTKEDIHFTSSFAISKKDYAEFKYRCLKLIEELSHQSIDTKEEEGYCFLMDLMKL